MCTPTGRLTTVIVDDQDHAALRAAGALRAPELRLDAEPAEARQCTADPECPRPGRPPRGRCWHHDVGSDRTHGDTEAGADLGLHGALWCRCSETWQGKACVWHPDGPVTDPATTVR